MIDEERAPASPATAERAQPAGAVHDAFISYSRRDAAQVEVLAAELAGRAGLRVWLDRARL